MYKSNCASYIKKWFSITKFQTSIEHDGYLWIVDRFLMLLFLLRPIVSHILIPSLFLGQLWFMNMGSVISRVTIEVTWLIVEHLHKIKIPYIICYVIHQIHYVICYVILSKLFNSFDSIYDFEQSALKFLHNGFRYHQYMS